MGKIIHQLRMLLAEYLLGVAVRFAPKDSAEGLNLLIHLKAYMEDVKKYTAPTSNTEEKISE